MERRGSVGRRWTRGSSVVLVCECVIKRIGDTSRVRNIAHGDQTERAARAESAMALTFPGSPDRARLGILQWARIPEIRR